MSARTTLTIDLEPSIGYRFQPTGFPNLGAACFERPKDGGWVNALHVESPQSMANHLESTTWDLAAKSQVSDLEGVPYVTVVNADGEFLTSSRLEAHRLASAYIMEGSIDAQQGKVWFERKLGLVKGAAMDNHTIASAIFDCDPLSLIHGVFFARSEWPWQPKVARAITCFIDADEVRVAASGGVKTDSVNTEGGNAAIGYGMVPYQRTEFTAKRITAYVSVDHEQLASYGLGAARTELLEALIDFELSHTFTADGLRLRTACDLRPIGISPVKSIAEATARVGAAIDALSGQLQPGLTVVEKERPAKAKKGSKADETVENERDES